MMRRLCRSKTSVDRMAVLWLCLLFSACSVLNSRPVDIRPEATQTSQLHTVQLPSGTPLPVVSPIPAPALRVTRTPAVVKLASPTSVTPPTFTPPLPSPTGVPTITLLFTGVIAPSRCVQAALDANQNPNYPYEEVQSLIAAADLSIGTFNATMSDYPPHTGCTTTLVLVGSPQNADALQWAGFDLMSVATNHIKDCGLTTCGDRAFFDTLSNLQRVGILPVGAGRNLAEAMQPMVATVGGVRFGIVSLGQLRQNNVFAGPDQPGIAVLNQENLVSAIAAARQVSDVVIAMPHWGPEDASVPTWPQRALARQLVEAGADLVVGNHTHVIQGMQVLNEIAVFYGLGNFVFDQWPRDHQQGVILQVFFRGKEYRGYQLIPTHVDKDGRVHLAGTQEAAEILERIQQASRGLK